MGIRPFSDSSTPTPPMPHPQRFHIERYYVCGAYVVLTVHYPDATTFEGRKVLVYRDSLSRLLTRKELDPHFSEDSKGPIARFEPTLCGERLAALLVRTLQIADGETPT